MNVIAATAHTTVVSNNICHNCAAKKVKRRLKKPAAVFVFFYQGFFFYLTPRKHLMNIFRSGKILKKAGFYVPFTLYFVAFALASWIANQWLLAKPLNPDSAFTDIFLLLLKVVAWFGGIMLAAAFLSVVVSWLYFLYQKKQGKIQFRISSAGDNPGKMRVFIRPVLKPFFGFIKTRFLYDEDRFSTKLSPVARGRSSLFSTTVEGEVNWELPQIKEYKLNKAVIYFEDFFQFFSIAVNMDVNENFISKPYTAPTEKVSALPRKTEETNTRIDEIRKVEGEFLNYKNFENNDDVRRIVWKIYAKNKELVVRIPEVLDPFASHIYIYPSFYSGFETEGNDIAEIPFLNYFKVITWTVYESLAKQGFEVRYIPDQDISESHPPAEKEKVQYAISTSKWHKQKDLRTFVKTNAASIVVISSFSDAKQVEELAEQYSRDISFIFVKLSDSLQNPQVWNWVKWLFIKNKPGDLEIYKRDWSSNFFFRHSVKQNEKLLEEIIEKYQLKRITV